MEPVRKKKKIFIEDDEDESHFFSDNDDFEQSRSGNNTRVPKDTKRLPNNTEAVGQTNGSTR